MIKILKLCKIFENKKAVNDLSLEIPDGKIFGFLGPNGAGKSTTIKMLTGILKPDSGSVSINGLDIFTNPIEVKKQLAYIPDEPIFFDHMTGAQYLNFISNVFELSSDYRKSQIEKYSGIFELELKGNILSYSHGMKQKLALIAAFIHDPKVIILDEPLVGLDPKTTKKLKDVLRNFANKGCTVLYSTHVMDVAERFCDLLAIINKGSLVYTGCFEDLKAQSGNVNSTLEDLFLNLTK